MSPAAINVAGRLTAMAQLMPERIAVVEPLGYDRRGKRQYRQITFRQLDQQSDRIAAGTSRVGRARGRPAGPAGAAGDRFHCPGLAIFKAGAVAILIDPGMGRRNLVRCLERGPARRVCGHSPRPRPCARFCRRRFARGPVERDRRDGAGSGAARRSTTLRGEPWHRQPNWPSTTADDPAAIIFTTGSTGPAKGVLYRHGNFDAQVDEIRDFYGIQPGEVDLACFPLFGLFNCAMGVDGGHSRHGRLAAGRGSIRPRSSRRSTIGR